MALTDPRPDRFDAYVAAVRAGEPLTLSRWGDGEWGCVLGRQGTNCDGQRYSAALRWDLMTVLRDRPAYELGLQTLAVTRFGDQIQAWLDAEGLAFTWSAAESFARHARLATLAPFIEALATRAVVMVGPAYLSALTLFQVAEHITVPAQMRHEDHITRLIRETTAALVTWRTAVVLVSAGMTANVLIHHVHQAHPDATLLDVGSLWEPYVGKSTRTYHAAVLESAR